MKQNIALVALSAVLFLAACSDEKVVPQRSPCVGLDNSPCGPKRPVNGKMNTTVENVQALVRLS